MSWFQQLARSAESKRSLETGALCEHPALCTFHPVMATTSAIKHTLQLCFSVNATAVCAKLPHCLLLQYQVPSGSWTGPDLLKNSTEKLNSVYKVIYLKNYFAYCRFSNMNTSSLFNQQVNWPDSLNKKNYPK